MEDEEDVDSNILFYILIYLNFVYLYTQLVEKLPSARVIVHLTDVVNVHVRFFFCPQKYNLLTLILRDTLDGQFGNSVT